MDDAVNLIARTDQTLQGMEEAEIERLNAALEASYQTLETDLLRKYPNYTADSQPGLLATQRGVLLANDLKNSLILINPEREREIEARFNKLLGTASQEGTTLGEELIRIQQGDDFVKATATLPIEAVAFAAKDAVKRLKKHDEKFQDEATTIISQGLIQGWGAMRTASQLRQRLGVTKGRAETIARTEIISAQDSATRASYKSANIEFIQRIATQDSKVCGSCAARAGQVYPVDTPIALHPRDRCFSAPFLPDFEQSNPEQSEWIKQHAKDVQKQAVGALTFGRTPFEIAAGISAAMPVWTPKDGYLDKDVERKGQSWAVGALALAVILRGRDPINPEVLLPTPTLPFPIPIPIPIPFPIPAPPPEQEENQLLKALLIGSAIVGMSVGSYYLARHRYRSGFKQSAKMAEDMLADIDLSDPGSEDQITFVAGGFAGQQGQAGVEYAQYFKEILPGHHTVGVPTPEFDVGDRIDANPVSNVAANWSNIVGTAVVKGRNDSAVRMAAMAAAHYRKYGKPVNLIGYSGGGMVASEAHEILKAMGVPVKTATLGTPWFGFTDLPADELISLVGTGDVFKNLQFQNRIDIDGVDGHWLDKYLNSPLVEFELNRHFTRVNKRRDDTTARPVDVVVDDNVDVKPPKSESKPKPGKEPKTTQQFDDEDNLIIDLYPEIALLSEAEIKRLPGRLQQKVLAARASAKGLLTGREVKGLLTGLQTKGLLTGLEIKGLLEGLEIRGLLTGQEVKGLLTGFELKGLLAGQEIKGLLEGLEIRGLLPEVDIKGLLTGFQVKGLLTGQEIKGLLDGLKIKGLLPGRLDPKQLPAVTDSRYNKTLEVLYQQLAKDLNVENDLKALLRGELPQLKQIVPVELKVTSKQEAEIVKQTAQQLYKQARSVERGMSRLAGFRIRQKLAEIARTDLPMLPKLQAYRAAILDEIRPIASPLAEISPPGTNQPEAMQRFNFAGLQWYTPELKPTSPSLDLMRKLTELDLPDEVIQSVDTIYLSRQKNAAEEYWRKRLKLATPQVPGTINLAEGSITLYRGKTNLQDALRQAGYLVAYRKFGQLEPPQGSEYRRAMAEGRTITPYGFGGDAADFADSVAQFFLDPDRLKRFNPQRYNALTRLLNYRHPEKPLVTDSGTPDNRGTEMVENLRARNREINQTLKAQREAAETVAAKQRSTKKFQQTFERVNPGQVQATSDNALTNARLTEESLDRLGQSVSELEQRSAQILNPFNDPYFGTAPKKIREAQRQAKGVERELAALDKATATAAQLRASAAELSQTLSDLSTRRESLKASSRGRDLELAWGQLVTDLDQAEQDLINLPRSNERAQALRDLVRMKAAIRAQESAVGVDVAALHRQAIQPKIDQLRALAENLEALQVRTTQQRSRLSDYQNRLAQLPQKLADLNEDTRARYNTVRSTKVAQSKLPQRVEQYRTLREAYTARLAEQSQTAQKITDDYVSSRPAAINAVQFTIEERLQTINDNLTVLAALEPGSVAWLVDSRNWELSEMPGDLAIVLSNQPGRTKTERLQAAAAEVTRMIGTVKGSANLIEQRIEYVESIARDTREQLLAEQRKWEQIRDDLADDETLSDRQVQAYLKGEKPVKAVDVMRYGNQLIGDLEAFNRDFVDLLLDQDGVNPRTVMDQSNLYRRARDNFASETEQTRAAIAGEIDQALGTLAALNARLERDAQQEIVFEVNGKARTVAQIRAELAQAQQLTDRLLQIRQVDIAVNEQDYVDPERGKQRQTELKATEARNARAAELKAELAEVNREIQKRREAAERGQKRGIATDRLEAQQRRILTDIAKLAGDDSTSASQQATPSSTASSGSEFPKPERIAKAIEAIKTIGEASPAFYKAEVDGNQYFVKQAPTQKSAEAERTTKELADDLGLGDRLLPVELMNINGSPHIVNPFVEGESFTEGQSIGMGNLRADIRAGVIDQATALKLATFDVLTANTDRFVGNMLYSNGKLTAIDHGRNFGADAKRTAVFNKEAVENNDFLAYASRQADGSLNLPLDREVIQTAAATLDKYVKALEARGLNSDRYRKRVELLERVLQSSNPTFEALIEAMGDEEW